MMNRKDKDRYGLLRKLNKGERFPLVDSEDFYREVDRLLNRPFKGSLWSRFRWLDDATLEAFFSVALLAICKVQRVKGKTHLDCHPSTFLYKVGYQLACKEAKRSSRYHDLDEQVIDRLGQMDSDPMVHEDRFSSLMAVVHEVVAELPRKQCLIIDGYYFQRKRLKVVGFEAGYSTYGSAKVAKKKAMDKVRVEVAKRLRNDGGRGLMAA